MVYPSRIHFSSMEQMVLSGPAAKRLLMPRALGGVIGLERELRHRDFALRASDATEQVVALRDREDE